jgi:hypothetical protein
MHPDSSAVTRRIRAGTTVDAKLDALRDGHAGQRCVIVTCGPSLGQLDAQRLRSALSGVFTIAVKQALHVVLDQADVACFNSYNVRRLTPTSGDTLRVFTPEPSGLVPQLNPYDLRLPMAAHGTELGGSLAGSRDFARYELSRGPTRPWGPGIVHETALYLALHAGATEIMTVGWDIAAGATANVHFDDPGDDASFFAQGRDNSPPMARTRGVLPAGAKRVLRLARAYTRHRSGRVYNRTTMLPGEGELVARSIPATSEWLRHHGVKLHVVTDDRPQHVGVSAVTTEDFLSELEHARATATSPDR